MPTHMANSNKIKKEINSIFKMNGLSLRSDSLKYLLHICEQINDNEREENLERIIECLLNQDLKCNNIEFHNIEDVVKKLNNEQDSESDTILNVIDAFHIPHFSYCRMMNKFVLNKDLKKAKPVLHSNAEAKCDLFVERYEILQQRTKRHELFTAPIQGVRNPGNKFKLRQIEYLLGSSTRIGDVVVLGMLTQLKEGKWYLEDPTGSVPLDLTSTNFHAGLLSENCFVLAEGCYEDKMFQINAFGFAPPETAADSRKFFDSLNYFGGADMATRLRLREQRMSQDDMLVFVSDVWLDQVKVIDKLRVLFIGYSDVRPVCFVFCGNFLSTNSGHRSVKKLIEYFMVLANLIREYPELAAKSKFIFVPGPNDPGLGNIFPRPALPACIVEPFTKLVPNSTFTSNPCRLLYCDREVVIMRDNIVQKLCRNCVRFPDDADIPMHFTKTIVSQGHMAPLPLHVRPIYWQHDAALRLYPLPDAVVCADAYDAYTRTHQHCRVVNPGCLPMNDFSFKVYYPSNNHFEDCKITM